MARFRTLTMFEGSRDKHASKADTLVYIDLDSIVAFRDSDVKNPENPAVWIDTGGSAMWLVYGSADEILRMINDTY